MDWNEGKEDKRSSNIIEVIECVNKEQVLPLYRQNFPFFSDESVVYVLM